MLRVRALYLTTFHSLIKHLTEEDSLFICCPALFISTRPLSSSPPPARQTILLGLPQRFAFLLSTNFLLHNAPTQRLYCTRPPAEADLISRGQTERVKEGAGRRTTHRFHFYFNLLPEAALVQIPVISPAAAEFHLHLLLQIHHKL